MGRGPALLLATAGTAPASVDYIDGNKPKCVVVVPEDPGENLRQFAVGVGMDLMF